MLHHAVDEVEDGGGLPAWTEKETALFPLVCPALRCRRSGSLHPPAGSVRDGPATRPRLVCSFPKTDLTSMAFTFTDISPFLDILISYFLY